MRKIILFVPGYYGSTLVETKTSVKRWANLRDFFFSQKGIPTTVPGTKIKAVEELRPDDILHKVTLFPILAEIDSYGKTLRQLKKFADQNLMTIENAPYDWRDDFVSSLKLIDKKIKSLDLTSDDELYVVAHSTGALLMSYYFRYGAQDVDCAIENWEGAKILKKAALLAAPFHGLMVLLRDTEIGTTKGINKNLMSARDYSSFKSSYMFLPPEGEDIGLDGLTGKQIQLYLHKIETWEKNKWGIFKFISDDELFAARKFIEKCMNRSQKFHNLLRAPIVNQPPSDFSLLYSWGKGHKTVQLGFVSENLKLSGKQVDFSKKESFVDGDGTVTLDSGRPLEYFKKLNLKLIPTEHSHLNMIAHKDNQKIIQNFLLDD